MPWQRPLEGYGDIGRKGAGPASLQDGRLDSEEAGSGSTFSQFLSCYGSKMLPASWSSLFPTAIT